MNRDNLLSIYLNDHLAGSTLGLEALANNAVGVEFGELRRRAERQVAGVEEHRLEAVEAVLAAPGRHS